VSSNITDLKKEPVMAIYAQRYPVYQPSMRIITAITNANPASVTTSFNHNYISGTIVRLDIPLGYGMTDANQQFGPITVTGLTTYTIPIDTTYYTPFAAPATFPENAQQAQCVPFGELATQLTAATVNVLNPNM